LQALHDGRLQMSCEDPDHPDNWPRNLFVWRSNLLGSSGKGHEYFLKHLLGTQHGVQGKDLGETGQEIPQEVTWHPEAPRGKLDLLVTLDFRISTTCVYSDVVLSTATWRPARPAPDPLELLHAALRHRLGFADHHVRL